MDAHDLKHVRDLLEAAESKEKVEAALKTALAERNVHDLKFAIPQAKEVGLAKALIEEAEEVLRLEEPKMKAREELAEAGQRVSCVLLHDLTCFDTSFLFLFMFEELFFNVFFGFPTKLLNIIDLSWLFKLSSGS